MLLIMSFPRNSPAFFRVLIPCKTTCILSRISHTAGKVQIGKKQIKEPPLKYHAFSCSMYLHLFEIAECLWSGSIRGKTKFEFAFRNKITRNCIFEVTNCRQTVLILSLSEDRQ